MRTLTSGWKFLEGLWWRDGRYWLVDCFGGKVIAVTPQEGAETIFSYGGTISSIGWLSGGDVAVVAMLDRKLLRVGAHGDEVIADLAEAKRGVPNDMITDAAGRCYIGTMGFDFQAGEPFAPGSILRVDPDGAIHVVADNLLFPNGMALLEDGRTLVVAETFGQRLTSFQVDSDGGLSNRSTFATFGPPIGDASLEAFLPDMVLGPDGICDSPDGGIWVSDPFGRSVVLVAPGGSIVKRYEAEEGFGAYSCVVGGKDNDMLAVCLSANHDMSFVEQHPINSKLVELRIADIPSVA
tara:strand:- start:750 stop:1634 length:885 start_codon:yes stop_codon:yes gene_type:complete